jgi:small ubiquitin-related modifier
MSGSEDNGGAAATQKPERPAPKKHINIKVKDQDNNEVFFKVKRSTQLEKLMTAYASQQGQARDSLRFHNCDGQRIQPNDTPDSLEMEDGERIDVFQEQQGGRKLS